MPNRSRRTLGVLLTTLGALAGAQAAAAAPPGPLGCESQPLRGTLLGTDLTGAVGLLTANPPGTPCADDATTVADASAALVPLNAAGVAATVLDASTTIDPDGGPAAGQTATAQARVEGFGLGRLGVANLLSVGTATASARATGACPNGAPDLSGSSAVGQVRVAGQLQALDGPVTLVGDVVNGLPTGAVVRLEPNLQSASGGTLTRTALRVTVLDGLGTQVLSLDLAQAVVAAPDADCGAAAPRVAVVPSGANRTVAATIAAGPGRTIASCSFALTPSGGGAAQTVAGSYSPATGRCTAALPAAAFPPGSYAVRATGTDDLGRTGSGSGTQVVAGPAVSPPAVDAGGLHAPVRAPAGTRIASCSFSVTPAGGRSTTVPGRFADGVCRASLPARLAAGPVRVVASATDAEGGRGSAAATVVVGPAAGVRPDFGTATPAALLLGCSRARVVLVDVHQAGRRTRLAGIADRTLVGRRVELVLTATRKVVARAVVRADGSFTTTAALPPKRLRSANATRYQARVGKLVSLKLKLARRAMVTSLRRSGARVVLAGRTTAPVARKGTAVTVSRLVACDRYAKAGTVRTDAKGRFRATMKRPAARAAIYRVTTRVPNAPGSRRTGRTFSLPTPIALG